MYVCVLISSFTLWRYFLKAKWLLIEIWPKISLTNGEALGLKNNFAKNKSPKLLSCELKDVFIYVYAKYMISPWFLGKKIDLYISIYGLTEFLDLIRKLFASLLVLLCPFCDIALKFQQEKGRLLCFILRAFGLKFKRKRMNKPSVI